MPLLFTSDRFLDHETGRHPENPGRLRGILAMLDATGLGARFARGDCRPAADAELARPHDPAYVAAVERFAAAGGGPIEVDTVVCPASAAVARLAAGTACAAVDAVMAAPADRRGDRRAVGLFRPPGHHARPADAMGFCLFNNVAVAAAHARAAHGVERVLIVDWDVHHGNGTQEVFYADPAVTVFNSHRYPFYPGTGAAGETGTGPGLGATVNLPLRYGVSRAAFLAAFAAALADAADRSKPDLVLVSAGFDAHAADPVGDLGLENEDFAALTRLVRDVADAHAGGRLVSLLEGGYNLAVLPESVRAHLEAMIEG